MLPTAKLELVIIIDRAVGLYAVVLFVKLLWGLFCFKLAILDCLFNEILCTATLSFVRDSTVLFVFSNCIYIVSSVFSVMFKLLHSVVSLTMNVVHIVVNAQLVSIGYLFF